MKTKIIQQEVEIAEESFIICNKCGRRTQVVPNKMEDTLEAQEYLFLEVCGGYASIWPGDMATATCHICQYCVKEFADSFKIPAEIN